MRKICTLILFCLFAAGAKAQTISATTYPFLASSGTSLVSMSTGATQIIGPGGDDPVSAVTNIGFEFWFNGVRHTQFSANGNGLLRLGGTVVSGEWSNTIAGSVNFPIITPYWDDTYVGTAGEVTYKVTGTAPNRVLVVEWKNLTVPRASGVPGNATFQCWLTETSGKIDFVYNDIVAATDGFSTGFATSGSMFASVTTSAPSVSYSTANNTQLNAITTGTQYTFTPLVPAAPTSLTFSPVGVTGMTLNWIDNSSNEVGFVIYQSPDGVNYSYVTQTAANATSAAVTGLTASTLYYYKVYAVTEGGLSTPLSGSQTTSACGMSGTFTVGPTGTYTSVAAAYGALQINGVTGPVTLEIQTTYAGETFPVVLGPVPCASASAPIVIRPQGTLTITGTGAPMFDLNGAQYLTIDGRVGSTGTTSALTISNTSTSGLVVRFINGASNDVIKYCTIKGVNTSTTGGLITFSTSTAAAGNNNNMITNCDLLDGSTTYSNGIYSSGTSGKENTNNTVTNCNIANFFLVGTATTGINLAGSTTGWTISNNKFYQTATRTYTTGATHRGIYITNTSGNGFIVTGNTIGYSSAAGTGTYSMTGTVATVFRGIELSVGSTTASSVQGNTITNISLSGSSGVFTGIFVTNGSVNIGNTTANTIGAGTGTGAITMSNSSTTNPAVIGINSSAATPSVINIQNNIIGSITTTGTASVGSGITGIAVSSSPSLTISGNVIGSTSTANSINSSFATSGSNTVLVYGINSSVTSSATIAPVISNNTIFSLTSAATSTASLIAGILHSGTGAATISGNTVTAISGETGSTQLTGQTGVTGIAYTGTGAANITQNTIRAIWNTNAGTVQSNVSGIGYTSSVNGTISRNKIFDLRNASTMATATTPPTAIGILIGNPGTTTTVLNNMISLGNSQTTNTVFTGIMNGTTTTSALKVYFNTVNIEGTATGGTLPTAGFHRGNYSTTAVTSPVDVRNNIFNNVRTGGSAKHYAIANGINVATANATGWGTNASNFNVLNANSATVGLWTSDQTLAGWKAASASDANSYTGATVTFVNTVTADLHMNLGTTPNYVEGHGTIISGFATDYDNDARPGPVGSVNGGGINPDLGADEFDGVSVDDVAPTIIYVAATSTCSSGDRTFTATILDQTGVPAVGSGTEPRVYYKKGLAGGWFSKPGTLSSGTLTNGTWSFTIVAADMGGLAIGDRVYYYVTAQDVAGTFNIGASPSAGFAATSVNAITTPPTTPNSYLISFGAGIVTVGVGQQFATITDAVNSYNINTCLTGPVTFLLTDANYSTSETFPITINSNPIASSTVTLTIKPATGVSPVISGNSTTSIFKFNGADYVTIDGSNAGTSSRNLTITNTNTGTSGNAVIWIASATASDGATNTAIKNCIISGNASTTTEMGIFSGGTSGSGAFSAGYNALIANSNNVIQNNLFMKSQYGVWLKGTSTTTLDQTNQVTGNDFGTATAGEGFNAGGLVMQFQNSATVSNNNIQNVQGTGGVANVAGASTVFTGLYIRQCSNTLVSSNKIFKFNYQGTGANRTHVLYVESPAFNTAGSPSNNTIVNNAIYDARVSSTGPSFWTISGISANGGYGDKFYYNTVNLTGAVNVTAGPAAAFSNGNTETTVQTSNINVRNNIFVINGSSSGASFFASYWYSSTPIATCVLDYNDLSVTATGGATGYTGYNGTNRTTLADWQTATSQEATSINTVPVFVSANDPQLQPVPENITLVTATPISGIITDLYGNTRSTTTPVRGAHEVNIPVCSGMPTAGAISASVPFSCAAFTSNLSVTGSTVGIGLQYQWQSSPDNITFTDIAGATNLTYTATVPVTTYYRRNVTCTLSAQTAPTSGLQLALNTPPVAIMGSAAICPSSTVSLTDATPSGTWSTSDAAIATVNASGVVTGVAGGGAMITYTIPNGCIATTLVPVSTAPPMTVSASPSFMCSGSTSTLSAVSSVTNYSVYTTAFAPETFTPTGTFDATSSPTSGGLDDGYFTISLPFDFKFWGTTYPAGTDAFIGTNGHLAFGTGISTTYIGTMPNTSYPSADIALFARDLNLNTAGNITYGTNGTAPNRKFIVSYNGVPDYGSTTALETGQIVIAETSGEITYHVTTAQPTSHTIGVQNAGATLAATVPGQNNTSTPISNSSWQFIWPQATSYTWTPSADLSSATIASPVTSTTTTVTYTVTGAYNGCTTSVTTMVSVNPQPAVITGTFSSCVGGTSAMGNTTPSGVWSSSNGTVASVNASGLVTANAVGTAIVSYTINSCSSTIIFTVNAAPGAITGSASVCNGLTATLANSGGIGSWTSSDPTVATIGATSGIVTGVAVGTTMISYINGCGSYVTRVTTVIASPSVISGATGICLGSTATLSNTASGGTWTSGNTSVATVNASTGVVSTVTTGFAVITYDLGTGCPVATQTEIVSNVTPPLSVSASATNFCAPGMSNMTASSVVTNYSVNTAVFAPVSFTPAGTFGPGSSVSSGSLDDGYFTISLPFDFKFYGTTYSAGTNAHISTNGNLFFGTGSTTTYMNTIPNPSYPYADIALFARDMDLRTSGSITYGTVGTAPNRQFVISYNAVPDYSSGVPETGQMVLNESTGEIAFHITTAQATTHTIGVQNAGATIADAVPGHNNSSTGISNSSWSFQWPVATSYTWSPATYLSATTGNSVTANGVTSTTIYTVTANYLGCATTLNTTLTVKTTPAPITGIATICESNSLILGNTVSGGTWESSDPSVATIDPSSGTVLGTGGGLTAISYTITSSGCRVTDTLTINARPSDITGTSGVCLASTTSLISTPTGGTWSSTVPSVAGVNTSGVVSGDAAGLSTISYMLSTGCFKTRQVTVNPLPVLNITPGTPATICQGESASFTASSPLTEFPILSQDFNSGLGSWTITDLFGDPVNVWQITSSPSSGIAGDGTPMMESGPGTALPNGPVNTILTSPSFSTMGFGSVTLSFNEDLSSYASVDNAVAVEYSIDNGTSWSMLHDQVDLQINPGTWSPSAPEVVVNLPVTALNVPNVKLRWRYDSYGLYWDIDNISVKGALPAATFTWAGVGAADGLSCTTCATPTITPTAAGANVYSVTANSTCSTTGSVTINTNPTPDITGSASLLCTGSSITLGTSFTGGTWVSSNGAVATVNASTGVVTGVSAGSVVISYTLPTTCAKAVTLNVFQTPGPITGALHICEGLTTALGNGTLGGTWSSDDLSVATINTTSGLTAAAGPGTSTITYTMPSGCQITAIATVDQLPTAFTGGPAVCEGSHITLGTTPSGGTWVSGSPTIAAVDMTTGVVTGVVYGTTNIVYTSSTGCERTEVVSVNPVPVASTGTMQVCEGLTTNLTNTTGSGTWSSDDILVAGVDATGMVTGNTFGTAHIIYTLPTGCTDSAIVTVNPLPGPIGVSLEVCVGLTTSLTNSALYGTWSSSVPTTASVDPLTGVMTGVANGNAMITYTLPTTCMTVANATVNPLPVAITGPMEVCKGLTTTLVNTTPGGTWSNDLSGVATVDAAGVVSGVAGGTASISYILGTGCMQTAAVNVNMPPVEYSVTGGGGYCAGTSGAVVGLSYSDMYVNYDLYQGSTLVGSATGTGAAISFGAQSVTGTYTVFATNTLTSCVNDMTGSVTVSITPLNIPAVTLSTTAATTTICSGTAITYTATPVNGGTLPAYNWEINGLLVPAATSAIYSYSPANGDIVKVTLNSNEICAIPSTASDLMTMTVTTSLMPVATISVPNTTVCAGSGASFSVVPTYGGTSTSYEWFVNGTSTGSTSTVYTYVPANGDAVTCKMGSNFTCRLADTVISNSLVITTTPIALPIVSLAVSPSAVFNYGTAVTFSAIVTGAGTATPSYQWVVNNTVQSGSTSSTFTSSTLNNNDSVTCKVNISAQCGFENFNSIVVKVKKLGVSQVLGAGNIMLVPNPNQGDFIVKGTIASQHDEEVYVEVVDMLGQIVYKGHAVTKNGALNERIKLSNTMANGMYMLNLRTASESAVFHFVLEQ